MFVKECQIRNNTIKNNYIKNCLIKVWLKEENAKVQKQKAPHFLMITADKVPVDNS